MRWLRSPLSPLLQWRSSFLLIVPILLLLFNSATPVDGWNCISIFGQLSTFTVQLERFSAFVHHSIWWWNTIRLLTGSSGGGGNSSVDDGGGSGGRIQLSHQKWTPNCYPYPPPGLRGPPEDFDDFVKNEPYDDRPSNVIDELNDRFLHPNNTANITSNIGGRVVQGTPVGHISERPFQVALYRRERFICGGSLLAARFVLTAAHCVENTNVSAYRIHYGDVYHHNTTYKAQVAQIIPHPGYSPFTVSNDIALIQLTSDVNHTYVNGSRFAIYNRYRNLDKIRMLLVDAEHRRAKTVRNLRTTIRTAAASSSSSNNNTGTITGAGTLVTVSGWGRTGRNQNVSKHLLSAQLRLISRDECVEKWNGTRVKITPGMICATDTLASACNGDSGGPLTLQRSSFQIGIVSLGSPTCYSHPLPNVYTNVYYYRKWIETTLKQFDNVADATNGTTTNTKAPNTTTEATTTIKSL